MKCYRLGWQLGIFILSVALCLQMKYIFTMYISCSVYLQAVDIYVARQDTSTPAIEAQLSLGRFADNQYQNVVNYMKSSEYEAKQALLKQAKTDYEALMAMGEKNCRYDVRSVHT